MSILDVNKEITEESLKSIGFFRAAYDVDIKIDLLKFIQVPAYFKLIPLDIISIGIVDSFRLDISHILES